MEGNEYLIGSCKYRNEKIGIGELELIRRYASVYDEIAIIGNRTGNLQVVFKIFSGETDGFNNTEIFF